MRRVAGSMIFGHRRARRHARKARRAQRRAKTLKRELIRTRRELAKAPRHAYGSYTPGVRGWADRWATADGRRILFVARRDYAGSMLEWAKALNRHTDFAVRLAAFNRPQKRYASDLVLPSPALDRTGIGRLLDEADVIHLEDEALLAKALDGLPATWILERGKPAVLACRSPNWRRFADDPDFRREALTYAARVALTPDLLFPWLEGSLVPYAIDCEAVPFSWSDGRVVAHAPWDPAAEGTALLVAAVGEIDLDLDLDVIIGASTSERLRRKRRASLFLDQVGESSGAVAGWYGHSALEAAAAGIPTMAHLSDGALRRLRDVGHPLAEDVEIIGVERGIGEITEQISRFFAASPKERLEKALATKAWVARHHDYPVVARSLADIYDELLGIQRTTDDANAGARQEMPAAWYDRLFASSTGYALPYSRSVYYPCWTVIADRLLRYGARRVLDVGCGPGQFAALLRDKGLKEYRGLDFSREAVERARAVCPEFDFVAGDARTTNLLEGNAYDAVVFLEVLEHIDDDLGVLQRVRPGTRIIATVPNFDSAAHVRHFESEHDVRDRYGGLFVDLDVTPHLVDDRSRLFILDGVAA